MDLKKVERKGRNIYKKLLALRGAFHEGSPTVISDYYSIQVEAGAKVVHIAHKSEVIISVSMDSISVRVEKGHVKGFDAIEFLDGFSKELKKNKEFHVGDQRRYNENMVMKLTEQLKLLTEKLKSDKVEVSFK